MRSAVLIHVADTLWIFLPLSQVSLSREDQALYEGWAYTSVDDFQKEVVDFLDYRDNHEAGFDGHGGGCCEIS